MAFRLNVVINAVLFKGFSVAKVADDIQALDSPRKTIGAFQITLQQIHLKRGIVFFPFVSLSSGGRQSDSGPIIIDPGETSKAGFHNAILTTPQLLQLCPGSSRIIGLALIERAHWPKERGPWLLV
jgi:hypothetical protein